MLEHESKLITNSLKFYSIISVLKVDSRNIDNIMKDPIEEIEDRRNALVAVRKILPTAYVKSDERNLFIREIDKSLERLYMVYTYAKSTYEPDEKAKREAFGEGLYIGAALGGNLIGLAETVLGQVTPETTLGSFNGVK